MIILIIEWKVHTFKIRMFPGMNTDVAGPLSLVWNCNKLVCLIGHSYNYNVCQYVFTENSGLLECDTVVEWEVCKVWSAFIITDQDI
jgi:hypothetical protein